MDTYNMAPGLCKTELPAGLKFCNEKGASSYGCRESSPEGSFTPIGKKRLYLGGVWLEHVKLVHDQAELAEVDVEVHQHISRHGGSEHFLKRRDR